MRYRTQAVAYPYFVVAMLFYGLQMAFGLLAAVKYLGPDPIKAWLPFDVTKEIHTNLLIVWVLTGFMGAAYWLVPEESRTELHSPSWRTVRSACGRSLGSRPWSATCSAGRRATSCSSNPAGEARHRRRDADVPVQPRHDDLESQAADDHGGRADGRARDDRAAVSPGAVRVPELHDRAFSTAGGRCICGSRACGRWCRAALLAYLLIRLSGIDREVMEKWLYVIVGLTFISGIARHGAPLLLHRRPAYWLPIGGFFSALEPLVFSAMSVYAYSAIRRSGLSHPEHARAALDARERDLLGARRGPPRSRAHVAVSQQVDPRHAHHADARPRGVLRRLRHDRARA